MYQPQVTVLVPTCNRPLMLRTALASIEQQTALGLISKVLVIENGQNSDSKFSCEQFPCLPIEYIYRDVPVPVGYPSAVASLSYVDTKFLAILFDDDWWAPNHLQMAAESLSISPDISVACSSYLAVDSETSRIHRIGNSFLPWLAAKSCIKDRWIMDLEDLILANTLCTSISLMTVLIKTCVWEKSLECIAHGNPYDVDRLLAVEFGRHGKVASLRLPTAYVRMHKGQEELRLNKSGEGKKWWDDSTERILRCAQTNGIDVRSALQQRLDVHGVDLAQLRSVSSHGIVDYLIQKGLIVSKSTDEISRFRSILRKTRRVLRKTFGS